MVRRFAAWITVFLLGPASALGESPQPPAQRYRVEQVLRLETTQSRQDPTTLISTPMTTTVEGRVRLILEQSPREGAMGEGVWRLSDIEVEGPATHPPEAADQGVERAVALGLDWMETHDGRQIAGALLDLPVLPLGEADPPWLTDWLRWAQIGSFAGVEGDPTRQPQPGRRQNSRPVYELEWVASDFRQLPCHIQRARWTVPVTAAPDSVSPAMAGEGVQAHTYFAAQSLEWVAQADPVLVYAERSGVRETYWDMTNVKNPELRDLVFRLRLSVQVRVERLP